MGYRAKEERMNIVQTENAHIEAYSVPDGRVILALDICSVRKMRRPHHIRYQSARWLRGNVPAKGSIPAVLDRFSGYENRSNGGAHRPSEEHLGKTPLKWLKEYDRVANFNKWDDMMCLANVYFFLDGTARQWYVNNEDALDSWEAFKNGLSGLLGDRQKYTRRAEEQLKGRAQRSGESTQSYIQSVLGLCQEVNPLMREDEKVSHLMKGVAEDIYQALLTREINDTASFIKWCNYIEDMKQKRVGRPRFERLPNVVPVASLTDETDLVSLIRTIVREEAHRLVNQTQESLDSDPQSLEEIVQDEVERVLAPVSTKPTETRPRPTYAAVTRKYRAPVQKLPPEPRKTDVWRTADNRPVCFHCGRPDM
ncbi:CCHC-type domain-containing protein [Trichonephila clavipes]|nr:CCHC-type domain-containing protein [Trichonephila clavipes]